MNSLESAQANWEATRERRIEVTLAANADSGIGFAPRFVAKALGMHVTSVIDACKRCEAAGLLERYERDGEFYWRRPKRMNGTPAWHKLLEQPF